MEGLSEQGGERPHFLEVMKDHKGGVLTLGGFVLAAGAVVLVRTRHDRLKVVKLSKDAELRKEHDDSESSTNRIAITDTNGGTIVTSPGDIYPNVADEIEGRTDGMFDNPAQGSLEDRRRRLRKLARIIVMAKKHLQDKGDDLAFQLERVRFAEGFPWVGRGSVDDDEI